MAGDAGTGLDNTSSGSMYEGNLSGAFSNHPREGAWASEQGSNAYCWELTTLEGKVTGDSRHQAPTHSPDWNSTVIVNTPVTRAESGLYNSEFPNH